MAVDFEKGNNLTVLVNGAVLGGVLRLKRTARRKHSKIREFLNDKPVAVIPATVYTIELELCRTAAFPFEEPLERIEISGSGRREVYTLCETALVESQAEARGAVPYTVTVTAYERSVLNE